MGNIDVERYFAAKNLSYKIIYLEESSATVELAAKALGQKPENIAKTLSFRLKDGSAALIVVRGTARIDNKKFKANFGFKAKMLTPEEAVAEIGHPVGGVCPFGVPKNVAVYIDESIKKLDVVYPAAGSGNSAVRMTPDELFNSVDAQWIDIIQDLEN